MNRSLEKEFVELIASAQWSVCLLQEAPPAWERALGRHSALGGEAAQVFRSLTSRNAFAPITQQVARWRPDLIGSWEGGSNTTLVRPPWQIVQGEARTLLLRPFRERGFSERRRMSFLRLRLGGTGESEEICVANLHATDRGRGYAERELRKAAKAAVGWAAETPLIFGGDFNLRPQSSETFEELERDFDLCGPTAPDAIDHLLARGLELIRPPAKWPDECRELEIPWKSGMRRVRLSDHAPVDAVFGTPPMRY